MCEPPVGLIAGTFTISVAYLASTSCLIRVNNSPISHTSFLDSLAICKRNSGVNLVIIMGINRLPYWAYVIPIADKPLIVTFILSYTYRKEDGLSPTHGDILSNFIVWALIICWGLPNLSFSSLTAKS